MSWPFALSEVITFLLFAIIFTSVHELDRDYAYLLFWLWLGVINANRSYWNINTSIHTSPVWLAPAGPAIKCPLVKCPSWPELGPKLPPWLRAGRERSNPGWRIDTDETAETNTTRHYNNNVTTLRDLNSVSALSLALRMVSLWPGGDLVSRDDKIIICIMMTFAWRVTIVTCHVTRGTRVTCGLTSRDMDPTSLDCDCHKKIPHITVSI